MSQLPCRTGKFSVTLMTSCTKDPWGEHTFGTCGLLAAVTMAFQQARLAVSIGIFVASVVGDR